jgi:TonB family protein
MTHNSSKSPAPLVFCRIRPATYRQSTDKERAVVVPQSKPFRSGKMINANAANAIDRDFLPETSSSRLGNTSGNVSGNLDESTALSSLKGLIAAGDRRLDPMLATITDAARQLTGASGAALAMWKDGAMICRARSGDTAPALGARLSAETGISGECLRTGKIQHCTDTENDSLVDVEVCRSLGLRSIAVLPIQGWRGVNGILEVFSTKPSAFTEQSVAFLQQLAALAERARAAQPHDASSAARKLPSAIERPQPSSLFPASDRVGDVVLAFLGDRSRPLVLGAIGLVAISLLALVIWLGRRGPDEVDGKTQGTTPSIGGTATVNATVNAAYAPHKHPPDNDPVWKANPGGESLFPYNGKPLAGTPVHFASKVDVVTGKKTQADRSRGERSHGDRSLLLADVAGNVAVPHDAPHSQAGSPNDSRSDPRSDETASAEPPSISVGSTNQSAFNTTGVVSAKDSLPGHSEPVSQGVTGGELLHRVAPIYPAQARLLRLEGTVILAAVVMEDGTVGDVNVVEGSAVLAQSAVDAVKHWRYKPYELDGNPVKKEIKINVDFKYPSDADSR